MSTLNRIKRVLLQPRYLIAYIMRLRWSHLLSDTLYLKIRYRLLMKERLNLQNPIGFNQKIQWLKIHDRNPVYTTLADKYLVKQHVGETIGKEYVVPLYGVFDSVDQIDYSLLPNQFVLKTTHSSSAVIICKNKSKLNIKKSNKRLKKWLKEEYFWYAREWAYKNIKPRIICEELIPTTDGAPPIDYKIYCFNGEPKIFLVAYDRFGELRFTFYDCMWNVLDIRKGPTPGNPLPKPVNLPEMIRLASTLSNGIPFVRVDFYISKSGCILFGEFTFYPAGGLSKFQPTSYEKLLGEWIKLP